MAPVPLKEEDYRKLLDVIAEEISVIPPTGDPP